jgi:hypothetical protein
MSAMAVRRFSAGPAGAIAEFVIKALIRVSGIAVLPCGGAFSRRAWGARLGGV